MLPVAQTEVGDMSPMASQPLLKLQEEKGHQRRFGWGLALLWSWQGREKGLLPGWCQSVFGSAFGSRSTPVPCPGTPEDQQGQVARAYLPGLLGPAPPLPARALPTSQRKSKISRMVSRLAPMKSPIWPPMSPVEAECPSTQPPAWPAPTGPQALFAHPPSSSDIS